MNKKVAGISKRHFKRLVANKIKRSSDSIASVQPSNENVPYLKTQNESTNIVEGENSNHRNSTFDEDLADWCIECKISRNAIEKLLAVHAKHGFQVPKSSKTLIKFDRKPIDIVELHPGHYYHYGIEKALQAILKPCAFNENIILIDVGIDGLPIFKSSSTTLWPILGSLSEFPDVRPFFIGTFVGKSKPQNVNHYLKKFVEEVQKLYIEGVVLDGKPFDFRIRLFTVDTPARSFLTGVHGHTSNYGCSKCTQRGMRINKRLAYSTCKGEARTDDQFLNRSHQQYHLSAFQEKQSHILEQININMVTQFPLDVMHLIYLGVSKKLLTLIWGGKKLNFSLSMHEKLEMDHLLISLRKFIPKEFCRKPRSFDELPRWKATELRQFVLYTGIVVLKKYLPPDVYLHFMVLSCAYRMLSSSNCQKNVNCIQKMMEFFVEKFASIYGEDKVSYNVHNLLHITECTEKYGNVGNFSAYKFENFMQELKKDCRRPSKLLQQINNRISERLQLKNNAPTQSVFNISQHKTNATNSTIYKNCKSNIFHLSVSPPNNCCHLNSLIPIKIVGFFKTQSEIHVIGHNFQNVRNYFEQPFKSYKELGICTVTITSEVEEIFKLSSVHSKLMCLPLNDDFVLIPILHHE